MIFVISCEATDEEILQGFVSCCSKAVSKASIQTNQKFANAYGPVIIPNVAALHQTILVLTEAMVKWLERLLRSR